jgi:hypothetical protein
MGVEEGRVRGECGADWCGFIVMRIKLDILLAMSYYSFNSRTTHKKKHCQKQHFSFNAHNYF